MLSSGSRLQEFSEKWIISALLPDPSSSSAFSVFPHIAPDTELNRCGPAGAVHGEGPYVE